MRGTSNGVHLLQVSRLDGKTRGNGKPETKPSQTFWHVSEKLPYIYDITDVFKGVLTEIS